MKKKLLITGASGFLGYHLIREFAHDWEVYAITHSRDITYRKVTSVKCDITNYIELGNYFDDIEPDAVIHAAAIADANYCEKNPAASYTVNVEASKNIAGISCDFKIPFAFTSTDMVFDGKKGDYKEDDEKNPVSVYGKQKSVAEDEILKIYPEALVFRLPLMFGAEEANPNNFLYKFLAEMRAGNNFPLFTDEYRSACGAMSISKGIRHLFEKNSGVIHLAGKERISRYTFGLSAVNAFSVTTGLIHQCSQKDVKMDAPRPADVSLNISKALSLGYSPLLVDEELALIAEKDYY